MDNLQIKYPIYIVSKGRSDTAKTAKIFLQAKIPFTIAVEPQEYDAYCRSYGAEHVAALPFSNLGLGSFPARNWCWENSIERGFERHFVFDDNIYRFMRLNNGKREKCCPFLALKTLVDFTEKFTNVGISGYNYHYFAMKSTNKPFFINTHVYSGMLIRNNLPFRWRLKYNEDVDLCLQALDRGICTILLNAFLILKISTVTKMKGGNQTELYKDNDEGKKMLKSKSLQQVWPQYVQVVKRFNRPHHFVNWRKHFKFPLKKKLSVPDDTDRQSFRGKVIAR